MSRKPSEGQVRVAIVDDIADITAPTTAEITAGTDISAFIPRDGVTTPDSENNVDNSHIQSIFDSEVPGTWGGAVALTLFRDDDPANDDAWDLFTYGTETHVVIGRFNPAAFAAGDRVEVYPVTAHERRMQATAQNQNQRFNISLPVRSTPELDAAVVA